MRQFIDIISEALNPQHTKKLGYWEENKLIGAVLRFRGDRSHHAAVMYDDNRHSRTYGQWFYYLDSRDIEMHAASCKEEAMNICERFHNVVVGQAPVKEALNPMHAKPRFYWRRWCGALYFHAEGMAERELAGVTYGGDEDGDDARGRLATRYLYWIDDRKTIECSGDEATEAAAQRSVERAFGVPPCPIKNA